MTNLNAGSSAAALVEAVSTLEGWYYLIQEANEYGSGGPGTRTLGALLSSVILAGGEPATPILVSGEVSETQRGRLVVVYPDSLVVVSADRLQENNASFETRLYALSDVTTLRVESRHNHFQGTEEQPRHRGFAFSFTLDGASVRLAASSWGLARNPLTGDDATYAAFLRIREAVLAA